MTSERPGNLPIRDLQRRMAEEPTRPDLGPNPTWEEILASDPDHEPHLDTPEGRFEAVLNIVKNGGMVLEVMVMDRVFRDYHEINRAVNDTIGWELNRAKIVALHLGLTISNVGAAARSDIDDELWQLTSFGEAIKPALIYTWQKILEQGIDPAKVFGSRSDIKKGSDGSFIVSAPRSRVKILSSLDQKTEMKEVELKGVLSLSGPSVLNHLMRLKEAGLVEFKSVDLKDSFTFFKITDKGKIQAKWPIYEDYKSIIQRKLSTNVELALIALSLNGSEEFTTDDIIEWISRNIDESGASTDKSSVNRALNFFSNEDLGLLEKSEFNESKMSVASLTEKGRIFTETVLIPLQEWAQNPKAVLEINKIRLDLVQRSGTYNETLIDIARVYQYASPYKNKDIDAKRANILATIVKQPGELTVSDIARQLNMSAETTRSITDPLIESGQVQVIVGKMRRKYLSMAAEEKSDSV